MNVERVDGGPRRRNIAFLDYRNKGLRECPEDLWQQRNQEICTQLTRYSAGGRGWRLQKAVKEIYFLSKKNKHRARLTFSKTNRTRECYCIRGATTRKIKGLRVWGVNRRQDTGTFYTDYQGQRTREKTRSEEMGTRSIPRESKPKRRHRSTSQRHEIIFRDIEGRASIKRPSGGMEE